eukprot:1560222-Pleurochrysis_carterae.AAC.1
MRRAAALHTIGVMHADAEGMLATQLAQFMWGLTGAHEDAQAVGHALAAAVAPAGTNDTGETAEQRAEGAGRACQAAVRATVDALAVSGAAGIMRCARRMCEELGAPAGLAARGAMAAQELGLLEQRQSAAARQSQERPPRRSPRDAGAALGESPRSEVIRRLLEKRAAERGVGSTPGTT